MKTLFAVALLLSSTAALAASPEDDYIAARDAAVARITRLVEVDQAAGDAFSGPHDREKADLVKRLQALVGPVAVKGFAGPASLNVESLVGGDQGSGSLDALSFLSADNRSVLLVTTDALARRWAAANTDAWADELADGAAAGREAVLRSEGYYFRAIGFSSDAALSVVSEMPLVAPPRATSAVALLVARSQDETPTSPSELIVSLDVDGRTMIAEVPLRTAIPAVAECSRIRKAGEAKISAKDDAYVASGRKDAKIGAALRSLRQQTATAFRTCFAARSAAQKGYLAAAEQARALADAMTAK
jgi:hypothetical protein